MYSFSDNIERGILYLSLNNREFFVESLNLIDPDYFEYLPHERIYATINNYFTKYKELPPTEVVLEELKSSLGPKESLSDYAEELAEISTLNPEDLADKGYYLDLVENFAKSAAMKEAIQESVTLIKDNRLEEVSEVVKKALLVGRQIQYGQVYFKELRKRWLREIEGKDTLRYPTILPACNAYLDGGLSPKELSMVVAAPGIGKSVWLVNQGVRTLMDNKKVLYVTLEMSEDKVSKRFDSIMTLIPSKSLKTPAGQLELHKRVKLFKEKFPNSELVIKEFPTGQITVNSIRDLLSKLETHENFIPDMLIVDYLELLLPIRKTDAEHAAQQRTAEELRGIGMEYNIHVATATQTNRLGESVELITRKELGESYGKIRVADWAISLNQKTVEYDQGKMRGYVIKARDSKQFYVVPMTFDYNTLVMDQANGKQKTLQV